MNFPYHLSKLKLHLFLEAFRALCKQGRLYPPVFITWDATKKCNLNCIHCSSGVVYDKELTTEQVKGIIDQITLYGVKNFYITGGEPLLRKDLFELLHYVNQKRMKTGFTTNGYYIDRNVAQSIKEANISFVQISIDGTKETHNNIREDEQSFNRAIEAIRLIKEICSIPVTVATTVMPQNLNELPLLTALLISLGVNNWNIGTVMPVGKAKDRESLFLSKSEFIQLLNFIINSKKKINIEITENFPYLGKYDVKIRRRSKICPIGILSCCIGYNGNVRGCPDQPDIPYYQEGNILTKNFATIWQEGFKRYRERIIFIEDKKCFACKYKTDCYGGCWVMRENNYQCILNYFK